MAILDQFSVFSNIDYHGSFTDDDIFKGDIYYNNRLNSGSLLEVSTIVTGQLDTLALYTFNGNINDSTRNPKNLFVKSGSGTPTYVQGPVSGTSAIYFDGTLILTRSNTSINDALNFANYEKIFTLQVLIKPDLVDTNPMTLFDCAATSSVNSNDNSPYKVTINPVPEYYERYLEFAFSSGALIEQVASVPYQGFYRNSWQLLSITKENVPNTKLASIKFYLNGELTFENKYNQQQIIGSASRVEAANCWLAVGGPVIGGSDTYRGAMSCLKIMSGAMNAEQIKQEYLKVFTPTAQKQLRIGSITDIPTVVSGLPPTFHGSTFGFHQTASNYSNFNDFSSVGEYNFWYSQVVEKISGSYKNGRNKPFLDFFDGSEFYYDSLVPSPVDYHVANGAELLLLESGSRKHPVLTNKFSFGARRAFALPVLGRAPVNSFLTVTPAAGVQSNKYVSASVTINAGDVTWGSFFPFESRYSTLKRLISPSNELNRDYLVKVSDSGSFLPIPWSIDSNLGGGNSLGQSDGVLNSPIKTNIFSGIIIKMSRTENTNIHVFNNILPQWITTTVDLTLEDVNKHFNGCYSTTGLSLPLMRKTLIAVPDIKDTYKTYFGVGRKYNYTQDIVDTNAQDPDGRLQVPIRFLDQSPGYIASDGSGPSKTLNLKPNYVLGTQIAGWRYGLYSAIPATTKITFRRNHFGYFRDILEQRPFTKFRITKKNTIVDGPITISFVSGSDAYVTSSNQSLNVKDSGIYRRDYTSGKPFADDL